VGRMDCVWRAGKQRPRYVSSAKSLMFSVVTYSMQDQVDLPALAGSPTAEQDQCTHSGGKTSRRDQREAPEWTRISST
jgi:hypothetical protein